MANGVPTPCVPAPTMWQDTYEAKVGGGKALLKMSCIQCTTGQGKIEFITSGQAPLPPDVVADMQSAQKEGNEALAKAHQEADAVGEAGLVEGLIPIWGSGRDLIHAAQTGDGWGIGLNSLFLVWDAFSVVAGVVSFGAATAAMMGAKAGVRTALKAAGKVVLSAAKKKGANFLSKSAKIFKNLGPKIVEFTKGLKCKFLGACFPAGTPIAAKGGYKNIEDIEVGDLVWSWDALTGDIGLKPVIATMENEANTLIKITSGSETIHATPEHPFWVGESIDGAWKNAEDLTLDDELWLLDKRNKSIFSLDLEPQNQPIKVYNFEVADWHNYFVGMWMMLVHNSEVCLQGAGRHANWVEIIDIRNKINVKVGHVIENLDVNSAGTKFTGCHSEISLQNHIVANPSSRYEFRNPSYDFNSGIDDASRVFEANPVVIKADGSEMIKANNQGVSSFFPENWDKNKILDEVEHAIANNHGRIPEKPTGTEYFGFSKDGKVEIHFYLKADGSIDSYFPKKR